MRLTLRTLLGWLDEVLPPEEQRQLGERVAGSGAATHLTARIRASVGHDGVDAPRVNAWGAVDDANLVAQYLDNSLPAEQLERFERTCLESEMHLAEVGACHGMLAELVRSPVVPAPPAGELATMLKRRVRGVLPTPSRQQESIAAAAAGEAIAAAVRQLLGGGMSSHSGRVGPAASGHGGATALAAPAAPANAASRTHATPSRTSAAATGGVSFGGHSLARGLSVQEHPVSDHVQKESGHASPQKRPKSATSPTAAARSERLLAFGSLGALLLVGGLIVTWVNSRGVSAGPRRASFEGQVSFDGKPVERGVVVLMPAGGTKGPTAGAVLTGGRFRIDAAAGPVVGRYRVEIKGTRNTGRMVKARIAVGSNGEIEEIEQYIPSRYNTASELEVDIKPGKNRMTFDLTSPPQSELRPGGRGPQPRLVSGRPVAAPLPKRPG